MGFQLLFYFTLFEDNNDRPKLSLKPNAMAVALATEPQVLYQKRTRPKQHMGVTYLVLPFGTPDLVKVFFQIWPVSSSTI